MSHDRSCDLVSHPLGNDLTLEPGDLLDHYKQVNEDRIRTKRAFNPNTDQPNGNLIRVAGRRTARADLRVDFFVVSLISAHLLRRRNFRRTPCCSVGLCDY